MKIKYIVFVFLLGLIFVIPKTEVFAESASLIAMPPYQGYCRVTGILDSVRKDTVNPNVFVMLYKIQKVEQLKTIPGYDCHGFVVGATAGLGLDSQITDNNFLVSVGQSFVADFNENDKFIRLLDKQEIISCLDFGVNLSYTSRHSDVLKMQQFLIDEGYLKAQVSGYFGLQTKNALILFQKDYNLLNTGKLDLSTRTKIKELTCSSAIPKAKIGEVCSASIECENNLYCSYPNYPAITGAKGICQSSVMTLKPVIYLYPENKQQTAVKLFYKGILNATLPDYIEKINGWDVVAYPDGKIINKDGREYSYLFWEGKDDFKYDMSSGFVVKGSDTKEFLHNTLSKMGLTPKEYNEFIVFWYPKMQENAYNLIHFADKEYTDNARLEIIPKPDSIQRVFMVWKGLDKEIAVKKQEIKSFERKGFSVVEWGGKELER